MGRCLLHELRKDGLALVHGDNLHKVRRFQPALKR